jgi:hypothetical protein
MATQLRPRPADNLLVGTVIEQIGRGVKDCLATFNVGKPVLAMHWAEMPGGGLVCHWGIDLPGPTPFPQ